jgi:uncharacterized protein YukE
MDIQAAQDMARSFGTNADTIKQAAAQMNSQLKSVTWLGSDANNFNSAWDSTHMPNLNKLCEELQQAQTSLTQQVAQQVQASGS